MQQRVGLVVAGVRTLARERGEVLPHGPLVQAHAGPDLRCTHSGEPLAGPGETGEHDHDPPAGLAGQGGGDLGGPRHRRALTDGERLCRRLDDRGPPVRLHPSARHQMGDVGEGGAAGDAGGGSDARAGQGLSEGLPLVLDEQ
ncbi:hypothetical protein [Streptomyces virginiae]